MEHTSDSIDSDFALGSGSPAPQSMDLEEVPAKDDLDPGEDSVAIPSVAEAARGSDEATVDGVEMHPPPESPTPSGHRPKDSDAAVADIRSLSRVVHQDTFMWGPFRMTFSDKKSKPPYGQWQATCVYHKLNDKTGCKRSLSLGQVGQSKDRCKRVLMQWCLKAPLFETKRDHAAVPLNPSEALDQEVLDTRLQGLTPPPDHVRTDEAVDKAKADSSASLGKRSAAPKGNAKKKAKAKAAKPKPSHKKQASPRGSSVGSSSRSSSSSSSTSSSESSESD